MQFRIATGCIDIAALAFALRAADPAAMVDRNGAGDETRISTILSSQELAEIVTRTGHPVTSAQVATVKSECCGGCGG